MSMGQVDRWISVTRPAWMWAGQLALLILGIHLAADRLDDWILDLLVRLSLPWPDPELPLAVATWAAVGAEVLAVTWASWTLLRCAAATDEAVLAGFKARWSVQASVAPVFWFTTAAAGSWAVAMATEDVVAPWFPEVAPYVAYGLGAVVAWRLGLTAIWRLLRRLPEPKRRVEGWIWLPVLVPLCLLAVRHGWPVWGWS